MFRRAMIFSFFCLAAICAIAYFDHVHIRASDRDSYGSFMLEHTAPSARHALALHPATQMRTDVQKDIWTLQGGRRIHTRLTSRTSELVISENRSKIEAEERLSDFQYVTHDGMHTLRAAAAPQGSYFYPAHRFCAEQPDIYLFDAPPAPLPASIDPSFAHFQGHASQIDCQFSQHPPSLHAQNIRARFMPNATENLEPSQRPAPERLP